ncbi:hypothetical protein AQJ46_47955 [Streptomyces canus]|uniref:Uncharacterized protein n=1 Tax=Streptomyces canus TaxID=58343 RepID=A0A101RKR5_9ACTN|nr:hypothetical protein [Streptomyces canus]KUN57294.1 hypothetical protein AQJ46_47955 [Streptomyces canus]
MQLDPRRGPLCVVQATITAASGSVEFVSLSMPTAPFGTPAWQLPNLVSYLHARYDRKEEPTASSFRDHMRGRIALPSPAADYPYAALHDDRVACLLSLVIAPGQESAWPQASLALLQQESRPTRCSWSSLEHERGTLAVLRRALREAQAEQLRLADLMRQGDHPAAKELHGLAERVAEWTRGMYEMARAAHTAARAADARRALHST